MTIDLLELVFKLFLSCLLGGIIGLERESINRPAGFRTHILVTVGATIVMITNIELMDIFAKSSITPDRLGASVISGIGFLGAGTIIRDGSVVKGLTTAASLWATACIGLALGAGFYTISILTTVFVFFTLEFFPVIEKKLSFNSSVSHLKIIVTNDLNEITLITDILSDLKLSIRSLKTIKNLSEQTIILRMHIKANKNTSVDKLTTTLLSLPGVKEIVVNGDEA
ncbi:MAG: MgtC/SapB family protein [Clostridia bacterium]|nr:MgtC/SapB family protein [Clostridia bacterium]